MRSWWRQLAQYLRALTLLSGLLICCGFNGGACWAQTAPAAASTEPKNILLLYSYGHGGKGIGIFDEGLLSVMESAGIKVTNLFFEYLDLERTQNDPQYGAKLHKFLLEKYAGRTIDLIITVQQPAIDFLTRQGRDLAPGVPAIVVQAPMPTAQATGGRHIVSMLARFDIKGTLDRALEIFPATRHVVVVAGSSESDRILAQQASSLASAWQGKLTFETTTDISLQQMLARVGSLPPHTIILFTQYNRDISGQVTIAYEVEKALVKAANAPVFGLYDFNLRNGGMGGAVISVKLLGEMTGHVMLDILNGSLQLNKPVTAINSSVIPMFDWAQIERRGGDASRLPDNSVFINREPSFWARYRHYVVAVVVFLLAQSLMIAGLLINRRHRRLAERALLESQQRLALATSGGGVGIFDWRMTEDTLVWDEPMFGLYGMRREEFGGNYAAWKACVHPQDLAQADNAVDAARTGAQPFDTEYRIIWPDGTMRHIHSVAQVVRDAQGKPLRMVGINWDISEQKKTEEELQLAASIFRVSSEGMLIADAANRIIAINPAFTQMTGYTFEDLAGKDPKILKSGRHEPAFYQSMWEALKNSGEWRGEIWDRNKNGDVVAKRLSINTIYNDDGSVNRRIALSSDITEKKLAEETIWRQANFDQLTGLPNRSLFHDRLAQEIKKTQHNNRTLALLFIDLDHFKEVNDTRGHDLGDMLLAKAARRIGACVRAADTVARLGGDEFTVVLPDLPETSRIEEVAQSILDTLAQPFMLRGENVYVTASIGITLYPHDVTDIDELLKNADQAMYETKEKGRNGFSYFKAAMQEAVLARQTMIRDLRVALSENQLAVHFQPIVELASGHIHKAEALLRWRHPLHGMVSPAHFIPLAEEAGLIHEIGDWVFRESAKVAKQWSQLSSAGAAVQISINKSPRQFISGNTEKNWAAYLKEIDLPSECIAIEITEGMLLEGSAEVSAKLAQFRDCGIQISLDDFGTGYSAMAYLKKFPIDYLKIDQSFVRDMAFDLGDQAIVEAIIVMAHKLGLKVVAEGVETEAQRALLMAADCDYAQGYLFARPMPAAEFEKLLTADNDQLWIAF